VTTQRLYRGENDLATLQLIINHPAKSPRAVRPDCPPELERIVMRALADDLRVRYATAEQLVTDLDELAREHKLKQSPNALAATLGQLFGSELAAWREAQARGVGLAQHLADISGMTAPVSDSAFIEIGDDAGYDDDLDDAGSGGGAAGGEPEPELDDDDLDDLDDLDDDLTEHMAPVVDATSPLATDPLAPEQTLLNPPPPKPAEPRRAGGLQHAATQPIHPSALSHAATEPIRPVMLASPPTDTLTVPSAAIPDSGMHTAPSSPFARARATPPGAEPVIASGSEPPGKLAGSPAGAASLSPADVPTVIEAQPSNRLGVPSAAAAATPSAPFAAPGRVANSPFAAPPWQSGQPIAPAPPDRGSRPWSIIDLPAFDPELFARQRRIVFRIALGVIGFVILLALFAGRC
jgi:hypothetical protein